MKEVLTELGRGVVVMEFGGPPLEDHVHVYVELDKGKRKWFLDYEVRPIVTGRPYR